MKYPFIARHRAVWSVSELCQALGVSRSGFYEWHGRSPSARERANERLTGRIRESFEASDRTYGSPRVWRDLRAWGERCGRHRVARLMRGAHLVARARRRRHPSDAGPRPVHAIAANLLDRNFTANAPNQKWAAGLHLCLDGRGLAVCRSGDGSVFASYRGLVNAGLDDRATGN